MMSETEKLKQVLLAKRPKPEIKDEDLLSSGSSLLNLACTGRISGAWPKGTYSHFVGDSRSGKTVITFNSLAEAAINPAFAGYRIIYSNPERRDFWDVERFWGQRLAERIEPPWGTRDNPIYPRTIQDFYFSMYDLFEWGSDGRAVKNSKTHPPFIRVEDSLTSLDDIARWDKFETNRGLAEKGKELEGSYGMGKAKANSDNLLWLANALADTGSILLVISQTRDKISTMPTNAKLQTVAGGTGLKFYACHEIWSSVFKEIKKTVNGLDREIGTWCDLRIKKNSVTGWGGSVSIPIYHSHGIDDTGSLVEYLIDEKHWACTKGIVTAEEFGHVGQVEKLIQTIEGDDLEEELKRIVQKTWNEVQEACAIQRKARYS